MDYAGYVKSRLPNELVPFAYVTGTDWPCDRNDGKNIYEVWFDLLVRGESVKVSVRFIDGKMVEEDLTLLIELAKECLPCNNPIFSRGERGNGLN